MSTRRLLAEAESEATRILLDLAITPPLHPAEVAEYLRTELVSRSYPPDLDGYYFRTSDEQGHVVVNCNPEKPKGRILFTTCHEFYHHITADGTAAEEHEEQKPLTATEVLNFRRMFGEPWQKASEADRRKLLMEIIHNIVVYPDKLTVRTNLSIGDITIPTLMFEKIIYPDPIETEPGQIVRNGAPDRTATVHNTYNLQPAYRLTAKGLEIPNQNNRYRPHKRTKRAVLV